MNLLLSNFTDENNKDLDELLLSYQEYFVFKKINDETYLYLDIDNLKNFINEGKEIKYRKFIFLYIENLINKKNKNYNLNYDKINNKKLNYIIHDKILNNYDIKNIKKIVSMINYFDTNLLKFKNNNIFSLDNNLYADIKNNRFINNKLLQDYKINTKINGFIINNSSYLKNLIIILNCIKNTKSPNVGENGIYLKTNCVLVFTTRLKIDLFTNILKSINTNVKYLEINNIKNNNIKYKDILECEYLFFNINLLSTYLKYIDLKFNYNNNLKNTIENYTIEQTLSENLLNNELKNIFVYEWNNIIIDNFSKINKNDIHYLKYLKKKNYNYINYENEIDDVILKNMSVFIIDNDDLNKYYYHNFKYFIKYELIIFHKEKNINDNSKIINLPNNEETDIISKLSYSKNNEIELAKLFLNSKSKFIHKDNENNIKNLIKKNKIDNNFTNELMNNNKNNKLLCCICMDRIDQSKLCVLDCGHYFCKNCILMHKINEEMNNYENKCPICRYNYNIIYNIIDDNKNFNKVLFDLEKILNKEFKKNIYIVAEYNEILKFIEDLLKKKYNIEYYKKNKCNVNNIKLISINHLKKNIIKDIDALIFFTFSNKAYQKYLEIKNLYNDYYLNKNKINIYLFNYNKN